MLISMLLKTQENVVAKWTRKEGGAHHMRSSCISRLESGFTKTTTKNKDGDLKLSEKKVSLVNALPPPLDLLAPPPKEAPQLSPVYRLAELWCINQEQTQDSTCNANLTTGWRSRHVLLSGSTW